MGSAISEYGLTKYPWWYARPERMARDRRLILALVALSPRYLSGVIGRLRTPAGIDEERLWQYHTGAHVLELLRLAGFGPADLRKGG